MKKKLLSLLSLILAVVMVFPATVFAAGADYTLWYDSTSNAKKTVQLSYSGAATWESKNTAIATVSNNGLVTAVAAGSAYIHAYDANGAHLKSWTIEVKGRTLEGITIKTKPSKMSYYSGDMFDPTGIVIEATYNNGDVDAVSTGFTCTPNTPLNTTNNKITINYGGKTAELTVSVTERLVEKVEVLSPVTKYTEGDKIQNLQVKVTYNDKTSEVITSGYTVSLSEALKTTDTSYTVTYRGITSVAYTIQVSAKTAEDAEGYTYIAQVINRPTKTSYTVGETFDPSGLLVNLVRIKGNITETLATGVSITSSGLSAFTSSDVGKTTIVFNITRAVTINGSSVSKTFVCTVTDLTISAAAAKDTTNVRSISDVYLTKDEFKVGETLSLANIRSLKATFVGNSWLSGSTKLIENASFSKYAFMDGVTLEVLDADGERKSSRYNYRYTIQDSDIIENEKTGVKYVQLAIYYNQYDSLTDTTATVTQYAPSSLIVEIVEPTVSYAYGNTVIADYSSLEEALYYCNTNDSNWGTSFNLNYVSSSRSITLTMGKDYAIDAKIIEEFSPSHNIVIDLNGNELEFYSDTIEIDRADDDYTITITNTSKTPATFIYKDLKVTLTLAQGDKFVFEYGEDLPGFVTVTVEDVKNGTVKADPELDDDGEVEVGMGSDVELIITPAKGYEVSDVVIEGKSVKSDKDNYSLKESTGVVTYVMKGVSKDSKVIVTFKETKSAWDNPFKDVDESDKYYSAVEFVYTNDLFKGTTTNTFAPGSTMTRAMFVTVLGRLAGLTDTQAVSKYGYKSDFTDVSADNGRITYAVPYIKWAVENGIVEGYGDGTFGPENQITHQQMYVMMYRYAIFVENKSTNISGVTLTPYDRSSVADWATDAVKFAQKYEFLVYTTGTRIDPTGVAKRHELAQLLEKFCVTVMGWAE